MVEAAMEAYRQAPNADPQITDLLVSSQPLLLHRPPGWQWRARASPAIRTMSFIRSTAAINTSVPCRSSSCLSKGNATEKELYVWGFLSAFATNDFDLAAQWLQKAQESGALQAIAEATQKPESQESQPGLAKVVLHQLSASAGVLDEYRELWAKEVGATRGRSNGRQPPASQADHHQG